MTRSLPIVAARIGLIGLALVASRASAQTAPTLGAAQSFAVLAGSTVTNTGSTVITGDVGLSPGSAVTGFPPGLVVSGAIHAADSTALGAQGALVTAYNSLTSQPCTQDLSGQDLGGLTLTAGVYCFGAAAQLTGTLTLDAQGNSSAVFIFKIGSSLTTASGSSVVLINSASPCDVFWQVGSSATLGSTSSLEGSILALTSITLTTGARLDGRALARNGAVTFDTNTIMPSCLTATIPSCSTLTLTPAVLTSRTTGTAFSQVLTASGGTGPYTFSVSAGLLPAGVTLSPAGVISGTPAAAGTFTFTVRAIDASSCPVDVAYSLVIAPAIAPPPSCAVIGVSPTTLTNATVGGPYSLTFVGTGGVGPYVFTLAAGQLPTGITLTPAGVLSGTPRSSGVSAFAIQVTDSAGCFGNSPLSLSVITAVPTLPEVFIFVLAAGLLGLGYLRLRRRA